MNKLLNVFILSSIAVYVVLWSGGVISSALWKESPDGTEWVAPTFLYLATMLILLQVNARNRLIFIGIGLFGFGAEVLGESTGFPFGTYSYGSALGPALFDVPIALVSAWIVVTVFAANVLIWANVAKGWWPIVGPITMVVIDFLLEPVATGPMDAWSWQSIGVYYGVPISNFIGWFVVSLPIFAVLSAAKFRDRGGVVVSTSVIAFFLIISLINLLWWPLIIAGTSFAMLFFWRRHTSSS